MKLGAVNLMKQFIQKLIYGNKCDNDTFINYLRGKGAFIGDDVTFFSLRNCHIDSLNCHLIDIGNHVSIVSSTILTHDYAWSVIKGKTGEILGNQRAVSIGNNVFIGHNSIILGGKN